MKRMVLSIFAAAALSGCIFGSGSGLEPGDDPDTTLEPDAGVDMRSGDASRGDMAIPDDLAMADMTAPSDMTDSGDMITAPDAQMDMGGEDMPLPELVMTVNTVEIRDTDDGRCTASHCSLPEAIEAARFTAQTGADPVIDFALPEAEATADVAETVWQIRVGTPIEIDERIAIQGPDPDAGVVQVLASDGFSLAPASTPLVDVTVPGVRLWNIAFVGDPEHPVLRIDPGVATPSSAPVDLRRVRVANGRVGLLASSGVITAERLYAGLGPRAELPTADLRNDVGVVVGPGAEFKLDHVGANMPTSHVLGNKHHGIYVLPGSPEVVISDVRVGGGASTGNGGHGVVLRRGDVQLTQSTIAGNAFSGVLIDAPSNAGLISIESNQIGLPDGNGLEGIDVVRAGDVWIGGANRPETCDGLNGCNAIGNNGGAGIRVGGGKVVDVLGNYVGISPSFQPAPNDIGIVIGADEQLGRTADDVCAVGSDCESGSCMVEGFDPVSWTLQNAGGTCVDSCFGARCDTGRRQGAQQPFIGPQSTSGSPPASCTNACNTIAENTHAGVFAGADLVTIQRNFIGLLPDGNTLAGNGGDGIRFTQGTRTAQVQENVVLDNGGDGIGYSLPSGVTSSNPTFEVAGNYVGTDGLDALGNAGSGVYLSDPVAVATIVDNVVSGNEEHGIEVAIDSAEIRDNLVGLEASGFGDVGNGGAGPLGIGIHFETRTGIIESNAVSNNADRGIFVGVNGPRENIEIRDNKVGTSADKSEAEGNGTVGLSVFRCDTGCLVTANVIAANGADGMQLGYNGIPFRGTVRANQLGRIFDTNGGYSLAGNGGGIVLQTVEQTDVSQNAIYDSDGAGIVVLDARNTFLDGNEIRDNSGYGIDASFSAASNRTSVSWRFGSVGNNTLGAVDLTDGSNDSDVGDRDVGANHLLNTPKFGMIARQASTWTIPVDVSVWGAKVDFWLTDPGGAGDVYTYARVLSQDPPIAAPHPGQPGYGCSLDTGSPNPVAADDPIVAVQTAGRWVLGFDDVTSSSPNEVALDITVNGSTYKVMGSGLTPATVRDDLFGAIKDHPVLNSHVVGGLESQTDCAAFGYSTVCLDIIVSDLANVSDGKLPNALPPSRNLGVTFAGEVSSELSDTAILPR